MLVLYVISCPYLTVTAMLAINGQRGMLLKYFNRMWFPGKKGQHCTLLPVTHKHTHVSAHLALTHLCTLFVCALTPVVVCHVSTSPEWVSGCNWYFSPHAKPPDLVSYPVRSSLTQKQRTTGLRWVRPERPDIPESLVQDCFWHRVSKKIGKKCVGFLTVSQRS